MRADWRRRTRLLGTALAALVGVGVLGVTGYLEVEGRHDDLVVAILRGDGPAARSLARWDPYLSRTGFETHLTPLAAASMAGRADLVRYLLGRGADPNAKDDHGRTALAHARDQRRGDIQKLLLAYGAR